MSGIESSSFSDFSFESETTRKLTYHQKLRLTALLDQYLIALEKGVPPSVEQLAADDRELIEPLRSHIAGLEDLHQIAAGFVPQDGVEEGDTDNESAESSEKLLGDFRLLEEIGRGGMGVVYRAKQLSLDRIVAIKLLPFAAVLDSRQIARFNNEAHAAALLHHPNIVPVYTVGSVRGVHYYAMQFIDGQSFDEVIAKQIEHSEQPSIESVVSIGIQIAEALDTAHQFGVIHRDVKPSNVMIDRNGKVWITDFGLARCQTEATLTKTGDVVGTMRYMSPEQARGDSAIVDGRTDVYSLGATLYEMLCLQPAFDGGDAPAVLRHIDERNAPLLRSIRSDVPADLETVVAKAMAKSRDGRYDTAADLASDLRRVLAGEPTQARPPTLFDRVTHWAARHRAIVTATAGLVLVALLGLSISIAMITAAKRESDENAEQLARSELASRAQVDRLGAQVAEKLADVPGAESVRRQLLQETLAYYQDFAARADDDPKLMHDLAVTYGKIGSIQSEVGAVEEAIESLEMSRELFAKRADAQPFDVNRLQELATGENNLALALDQAGQYEAAFGWYRSAIARQEDLVRERPGDADAKAGLALSLNNLGLLLSKTGNLDDAEDAYQRSIELSESIADAKRTGEVTRQLASTYQNLSGLLADRDPGRAVEYARTALRNQTDELNAQPGDPKTASRVALTLNSLGAAQVVAGDVDSAIHSYRQAIDLQSQLIERWPNQLNYQRDIAVTHNNYGLALAAHQRYEEAREAFDQSLAHQIPLAELFVNDADLQSTLGGVYNNRGFAQEKLGEVDGAIESYRMAVKHQTRAYQSTPEVPQYREYLSKHYFNYAKLLRSAGRDAEAFETAKRRRELWKGDGERLAGVAEEVRVMSEEADLERISVDRSETNEQTPINGLATNELRDFCRETMQMAIDSGYDPPKDMLDRPVYRSVDVPIRLD